MELVSPFQLAPLAHRAVQAPWYRLIYAHTAHEQLQQPWLQGLSTLEAVGSHTRGSEKLVLAAELAWNWWAQAGALRPTTLRR